MPAALAVLLVSGAALARETAIEPGQWRVIDRDSGPDRYYSIAHEGPTSFLRARYRPPMRTTSLGWQAPDDARASARTLRWSWRVEAFPTGGNECDAARADSAAAVYATWKRGLRYYALKFVWSTAATKGSTCNTKRNPFVAQDSVVLESGGPVGEWRREEIDLPGEFRRHFEGGDASASVPDFVGVGVLTDGDQTQSESAADYAGVAVVF
ncbi:MAG TPA: DUF3047 domain-containing protein [Polyangiaceae bacterium]